MIFKKNPDKKTIKILREAVKLRNETKEVVKKSRSELENITTREKLKSDNLGQEIALDCSSIDIFPKLNNPDYISSNYKVFFPLVREYLENLKQGNYSEAIKNVREYINNNSIYN